jgi:hypothetical protein
MRHEAQKAETARVAAEHQHSRNILLVQHAARFVFVFIPLFLTAAVFFEDSAARERMEGVENVENTRESRDALNQRLLHTIEMILRHLISPWRNCRFMQSANHWQLNVSSNC